jgi:hypothetical protein
MRGPTGTTLGIARFNPAGNGVDPTAVYYSLLPQVGACLADTGLPAGRYDNAIIRDVPCPATLLGYTPVSGEPGYLIGTTDIVSYNFAGCDGDTAASCPSQGTE